MALRRFLTLLTIFASLACGAIVVCAQAPAKLEDLKILPTSWRITNIAPIDLSLSPGHAAERARIWQMTGPFGGDVTALAIDPRNSERVFIGAKDGQLFRTNDGGQIWRRLRPGLRTPGYAVTVIWFDRVRANSIYVGVKQVKDLKDDATGGGLFVSRDNGESWRELAALHNHSVRGLVQSATDPNVFITVARDGLYRSADHGLTWERITPENHKELTGFHSAAIDPRDINKIFVGTWHLPWKTRDGGQNWTLAGMKDTGMVDDSDIFSIQIDEASPDSLWMSACSGIYRSTDASLNWTKVKGIPYSSRRTHVIYQHPTRPELVFAGTIEGLWRSEKGGKPDTWSRVTSRIVINAVAVHPEKPERVFVGTENYGVLISDDGGLTYELSNAGFISRYVNTVVADRSERGRVYAGVLYDEANGGFFISEDGGVTWRQSVEGMGVRDVYSIYQAETAPDTIYAGTNSGLFRSDDRGRNWTQVKKVEAEPEPPAEQTKPATPPEAEPRLAPAPRSRAVRRPVPVVQKVTVKGKKSAPPQTRNKKPGTRKPAPPPPTVDPQNEFVDLESQVFLLANLTARPREGEQPNSSTHLIAATWDGLFRSEEEKKGWKELKLYGNDAQASNTRAHINALATSPHAPGLLLVGTENGLFISRDNGETFTALALSDKTMRVRVITFDPRTAETIYIGTAEGFFRSLDGGQTWEQRGGGMPVLVEVSAIAVSPLNPNELYLSDHLRGGFYHSLDRGRNWEPLDISALPSVRLLALIADPFNQNRIYAGSFSGGVYVMSRQ